MESNLTVSLESTFSCIRDLPPFHPFFSSISSSKISCSCLVCQQYNSDFSIFGGSNSLDELYQFYHGDKIKYLSKSRREKKE